MKERVSDRRVGETDGKREKECREGWFWNYDGRFRLVQDKKRRIDAGILGEIRGREGREGWVIGRENERELENIKLPFSWVQCAIWE